MADDDFDIDIYGDTNLEDQPTTTTTITTSPPKDSEMDIKTEEHQEDNIKSEQHQDDSVEAYANSHAQENEQSHDQEASHVKEEPEVKAEATHANSEDHHQQIKSTDESGKGAMSIPKQAPQQQGIKRKEGSDERPIDPGATTAILISDMHWWNTDDDIRGWVNQAHCEDELKDITFSEHKVNGKSKGQAYVEFSSQQAATAAKHKIDAFGEGQQYVKKHTVTYTNPNINPFKTLPKDVPARKEAAGRGGFQQNGTYNNFRGGRGGFNRGGAMGGGFRGNFQGGQGIGGMGGGFQQGGGNFGGGFSQGMGGNFGGGFNRGGMMGGNMRGGANMRGGRGGMNNAMMGGLPMGGMGMGGMGGMQMGGMPNMGMMGKSLQW